MSSTSAGVPAQVASAGGSLVSKLAGAADPGKSLLGRVGDTAAGVQLAARLLPAGWRLVKRYPLRSSLLLLGVACIVYASRPASTSPPE